MQTLKKVDKALITFMNKLASFVGKPYIFVTLLLAAVAWFIVGIFIEYDTWYDIMDVFIFISTFFLIFVVQSSQNADTEAIQDKLDDIIEALPKASKKDEGEEKRIKRGEQK